MVKELEKLERLHSGAIEFWKERASIREYCAGMSREAAEQAALADVTQWADGRR